MKEVNLDELLELPVDPEESNGATTIKEFLYELLTQLWALEEGFSGKRPFGNSGWSYELYTPLVVAGMVEGSVDEDGYIEEVDDGAADKLIFRAIEHVFGF